jgi:hypothetical protein
MVRLVFALSMSFPLLAQVDFATSIHPILETRCAPCHTGAKPSAGFSVESRESILKAIKPGVSDDSLLLKRIKTGQMPPIGAKLTESEIENFRSWIDEGAKWTDTRPKEASGWLSPIKPRIVSLPDSPAANPIDKFVGNSQVIGDALFIRRVTLDIWGMVPSADATKKFIADKNPSKREQLIDSLLGDNKKYAENWISFWNDLLRNDQGVNYAGTRKSITPWLLRALENNMPFNDMAFALLNPVKPDDPDGFLVGVNWRGDINASQTPFMQAAQNSAQVFLGVNLKCASCHDSFSISTN